MQQKGNKYIFFLFYKINDNDKKQFRRKHWNEINYDFCGTYPTNNQIKFKTIMLKSRLCSYIDTYRLVKGSISVCSTTAANADANNVNKKVIFKKLAPFSDCNSKINNKLEGNAKNIDLVIPMYNLICLCI